MTSKDLNAHPFASDPERIPALDGGGIRGIPTVQLLERIEQLVRERRGDDSAVPSEYSDLIGGTSTGAIIALALGWPLGRIDMLY